jgi:hypothetical protein
MGGRAFRYDTCGANGRRMRRSPHAAGGRAADHPSAAFPVCPCGTTMTLHLGLDFDSAKLRELQLWSGRLLLFACDGPAEEDGRTFFDYTAPSRPIVFTKEPGGHAPGSANETVPERLCLEPMVGSDTDCMIGGVPAVEPDPVLRWCPRCRRPMAFIAQYLESLAFIPHDETRSSMLGSPYPQRWYGCRLCKVIAWLGMEALADV